MKKIISLFLIAIFIVPCCFVFGACGNSDNSILKINKLESVYYLNEEINFENSKIEYKQDDRNVVIKLNADMISGFTSKTPGQRTMTITYKGEKIECKYTVLNLSGRKFNLIRQYTKDETGHQSAATIYNSSNLSYNMYFEKDGVAKLVETNISENKITTLSGKYTILENGNIQTEFNIEENKIKNVKISVFEIMNEDKTIFSVLAKKENNLNFYDIFELANE